MPLAFRSGGVGERSAYKSDRCKTRHRHHHHRKRKLALSTQDSSSACSSSDDNGDGESRSLFCLLALADKDKPLELLRLSPSNDTRILLWRENFILLNISFSCAIGL
jgi:hypothetical protein